MEQNGCQVFGELAAVLLYAMRPLLSRILHWKYIVPAVIGVIVVGISVLAATLTYTSELEKHNDFCASCHTEPETTNFMRFEMALSDPATDLAAFHHAHAESSVMPHDPNMRCIDCHVGEGFLGRATVVTLSAYDALRFFTGTAEQPAHVVFNVQNEACLKCHEADVKKYADQPETRFIIDNHYHYKYYQPGAPPVSCTSCHSGHNPGSEANQFVSNKLAIPVCQACHQFEGKGPLKMQ